MQRRTLSSLELTDWSEMVYEILDMTLKTEHSLMNQEVKGKSIQKNLVNCYLNFEAIKNHVQVYYLAATVCTLLLYHSLPTYKCTYLIFY